VVEPEATTAAALFKLVWDAMVDVLGSAATATLVRRSARRAAEGSRELEGLVISRDGFDYAYRLPASWTEPRLEAIGALRVLAAQLSPLLFELTGPVIVRRLSAIPALQRSEILFQEGVS
jgi:hypothetical protein